MIIVGISVCWQVEECQMLLKFLYKRLLFSTCHHCTDFILGVQWNAFFFMCAEFSPEYYSS